MSLESGVWSLESGILKEVPLFFLAFLRIVGFLFASPILGSREVPPQIPVGLSLLLTFLLYPLLHGSTPPGPQDLTGFTLGAVGEVVVGLTLGFAIRLLFAGALMAGELMGLEMGVSLASVLDPQFPHPTGELSRFLHHLMVLVFFASNGHHLMLQALGRSFQWVPLFGLGAGGWGMGAEVLIRLFGSALHLTLRLSAPLLAALFVAHTALALLARAAPQMNVGIIGAPLILYLGFLLFLASLPMMVRLFEVASGSLEAGLLLLVKRMSHALP